MIHIPSGYAWTFHNDGDRYYRISFEGAPTLKAYLMIRKIRLDNLKGKYHRLPIPEEWRHWRWARSYEYSSYRRTEIIRR